MNIAYMLVFFIEKSPQLDREAKLFDFKDGVSRTVALQFLKRSVFMLFTSVGLLRLT